MSGTLRFIEPQNAADLAAFDQLNWDYLAFLRGTPGVRDFINAIYPDDKYHAALAQPYMRPTGLKRLALQGQTPVGCGTIHTIGPDTAEIKRVFIAPQARGGGAGRALMMQLITDCREMSFDRILLDTGKPLTQAQALYDSLGFQRRDAYHDAPEVARDALVFFELDLTGPT